MEESGVVEKASNEDPMGYDWGERLPNLETSRLVLRHLEERDIPALHRTFSDPDVLRYMDGLCAHTLEEARELLDDIDRHFAARTLFQWGIALRESDQVVGTVTLFKIEHRHGEIGYAIARDHQRQGYGREAVEALVEFAFGSYGLHRLEADVDPRNAPSLRLLEGLGFEREGYFRERYFLGGESTDGVFLGLLARDWRRRGI